MAVLPPFSTNYSVEFGSATITLQQATALHAKPTLPVRQLPIAALSRSQN